MRAPLALLPLLAASPAAADPRCAAFGQPAYTAQRAIAEGAAPPVVAQVTFQGPRLRIEAAGPAGDRLVTLVTPELHAMFLARANPPLAMRMPSPSPPDIPGEGRRLREERSPGRVTLITELRGASGRWHEIERSICRRDGVLLEARQWHPREGGGVVITTRQTEIRLTRTDPALFRLPAGFRLVDAPPPPLSRRIAPPPG